MPNPEQTPEVDPTLAPQPETPAVEPVAAEPNPAPAPAVQHNPYLLRQAIDLGIPQELIEASTADELQRSVFLASSLRRGQPTPQSQPQPQTPAVEPEPDLGLNAQELAELQELNPVLLKAIKANAKHAADAKRHATEQAEAIRRQQSGQELARRVNEEMSKYGTAIGQGTAFEGPRKNAVLTQLAQLEAQGAITANTPPEFAVRMAVETLFGPQGVQTQKPAVKPVPTPTPTARPTNRINAADEELSKESLIDEWERKLALAAERDKGSRNGAFVP